MNTQPYGSVMTFEMGDLYEYLRERIEALDLKARACASCESAIQAYLKEGGLEYGLPFEPFTMDRLRLNLGRHALVIDDGPGDLLYIETLIRIDMNPAAEAPGDAPRVVGTYRYYTDADGEVIQDDLVFYGDAGGPAR